MKVRQEDELEKMRKGKKMGDETKTMGGKTKEIKRRKPWESINTVNYGKGKWRKKGIEKLKDIENEVIYSPE